jgi:hypothetical protein
MERFYFILGHMVNLYAYSEFMYFADAVRKMKALSNPKF